MKSRNLKKYHSLKKKYYILTYRCLIPTYGCHFPKKIAVIFLHTGVALSNFTQLCHIIAM